MEYGYMKTWKLPELWISKYTSYNLKWALESPPIQNPLVEVGCPVNLNTHSSFSIPIRTEMMAKAARFHYIKREKVAA